MLLLLNMSNILAYAITGEEACHSALNACGIEKIILTVTIFFVKLQKHMVCCYWVWPVPTRDEIYWVLAPFERSSSCKDSAQWALYSGQLQKTLLHHNHFQGEYDSSKLLCFLPQTGLTAINVFLEMFQSLSTQSSHSGVNNSFCSSRSWTTKGTQFTPCKRPIWTA